MINIEYDWPIEKDHINIDDRIFFRAVFQIILQPSASVEVIKLLTSVIKKDIIRYDIKKNTIRYNMI